MKIKVSNLRDNPFRDFSLNPIESERVKSLMDSINKTDFWDNLVCRKSSDETSAYEIAYGHHRFQALIDLGWTEVDIPVRKLSDPIMIQMMADENYHQQGNNPRAIEEAVIAAVDFLQRGLDQCETAEEFTAYSAISGGTLNPQRYAQMRSEGPGAPLVREFLGKTWALNPISKAISFVKARKKAAKAEKELEKAKKDYDKTVKQKGAADKLAEEQDRIDKANEDLKEAERLKGYSDVYRMFPKARNATTFVEELESTYSDMKKSDQMRFANQIINEGTGYRDIPRRLGELVLGQKEWQKEAKKREQAKKRKQANWRAKWQKSRPNISLDEFVVGSVITTGRKFTEVLDEIIPHLEHIEDTDILRTLLDVCAAVQKRTNTITGGLSLFDIKDVN